MTKTIEAKTLKQWLHDGDEIALLDVREHGQYGEGHPFYAVPAPYSRLELDIGRLVPRRGTRMVLLDDGDGVAERAAKRLAGLGYSNLRILAGGAASWATAGFQLFKGVNLPSKTFGEMVEHVYDTPRVSVTELDAMIKRGDNLVVLDGRTVAEYRKMSIPTGISCPNGELAYRAAAIVKDPKATIVVNCAGRTRSIIGAQTLRNFGIDNPVYALENGTQGWYLADFPLERGADRLFPQTIPEAQFDTLRAKARALADRHGVKFVNAATVAAWAADQSRNLFLCDVRTPEEFAAGSLPGAQHTPGGQFQQAADQYVGVRNARVVVFDAELVRAPVCASWLAQMGHEVYVLNEGTKAKLDAGSGPAPKLPALPGVAPAAVAGLSAVLLDLRAGMDYRKEHVEGATWAIRPRLRDAGIAAGRTVALLADEPGVAQLAAIDLRELGLTDVRIVTGGHAACKAAGLALTSTPQLPADAQCIDFLFFVHDRHEGNKAAARAYLEWETGLLRQIDDQERASFRLPAAAH
jgi:rhodanese-related sulfurtransferase